jgi:hypothetical protein
MAIEEFGLDNGDIKSTNFEKFKGEKGKKYRVGLVAEDLSKGFLGAKTHYIEGLGYVVCKSTDGEEAVCCSHNYDGNTPKWKIGITIIVYDVSSEGKVTGGKFMPWIFNDKIYNQLKNQHKEWNLEENDLELECTDSKYQSFTIALKKGCLWRKSKKLAEQGLSKSADFKKAIKRNLGRDLSITEIKEGLGIGSELSDASADINIDDVADSLDLD